MPAKLPASQRVGTFRFQLIVTAGNAATTLSLVGLALLKERRLRWSLTPWGALGALVLTAVQCAAWPAVHRLGASAGPGIWCGVGMTTSFLWGAIVFGEALRSVPAAAAAIGLLAIGVALTAASQASEDQLARTSRRLVALSPPQGKMGCGDAVCRQRRSRGVPAS